MKVTDPKVVGMERHVITVLTLVIVALILWVGNGVQQTQVKLAAIEVDLTYIKRSLDNDRDRFASFERRLDVVERKQSTHMDGNTHE